MSARWLSIASRNVCEHSVRPFAHTPALCWNRFRLRPCFSHVPALPLLVASLILDAAQERCLYTEIHVGSATCLCCCILGENTKKTRKTILDTSYVGCKIFGRKLLHALWKHNLWFYPLAFRNRTSYTYRGQAHRYPPNTPLYYIYFFQQKYVLGFLNMLHTLHFSPFKMPFIS
jgi:hypothetical protein